jgi:3-methyladenine DNA glycosylase AlkD
MNVESALQSIMTELRARADPASAEGMARYGIASGNALGGTSVPQLRAMAKRMGKDHALAAALWSTEVHEARLLATMVDDPHQVSERQMESWAGDLDSWDICDQACANLFWVTSWGWVKANEWPSREEEFVKRAGFALMAALAVHDKRAGDDRFVDLLSLIEREADDERNYVRKAVNWALRQIGKRNTALNREAAETAERIAGRGSRAARWIGSNALREIQSEAVRTRLEKREGIL